jgi:spore germination protein KB
MNKEIISNKQPISMIVLFIIGSTLMVGGGADVKQDSWIALLLGMIMALPAILVYSRILTLFPGKDLYSILEILFGKIFSKLISGMYIWYFFHLGALVIRNFSEYIKIVSFPETPQFYISVFIGSVCIWMARSGLEVIARWCFIVFIFTIIMTVFFTILGTPQMKFINIQPVLYNGIKPVAKVAFGVFSFPFAETVVFMTILPSLKANLKIYKIYLSSVIIGCAVILLIAVRNILMLGGEVLSNVYFPTYSSVSLINIGEFLQRIEILVSSLGFLAGIAKISICIYSASLGLSKIFNLKNQVKVCSTLGLLMINLSYILYDSSMEMVEWASNIYPYYAVPFQIILPIIILVASKISLKYHTKYRTKY